MIRLSNLTLPLDHPPEALEAAVCERLGIAPADLLRCTLARRGNDARKKTAIKPVYSLDLDLADEAVVLAAHADYCRSDPPRTPPIVPRCVRLKAGAACAQS